MQKGKRLNSIYAEMARRGWTIDHVARMWGCSYGVAQKKLNGKARITTEEAIIACREFNRSFDYLFLEVDGN